MAFAFVASCYAGTLPIVRYFDVPPYVWRLHMMAQRYMAERLRYSHVVTGMWGKDVRIMKKAFPALAGACESRAHLFRCAHDNAGR